MLTFDAFGTAERPIIVEFAGSNLAQKLITFNIGRVNFLHCIKFTKKHNDNQYVNIL